MKPQIWPRALLLAAFSVLLMLLLGWGKPIGIAAQSDAVTWSKPINLSNTPPLSTHPAIVADGHGHVHVFWSEDFGGQAFRPEDGTGAGNSILYSRWDGTSWTAPNDVLYVPGEAIADYVAVAVGRDNMLHAVWIGLSNVYYSNAPAGQALSGRAWSEPAIVATNNARSRQECSVTLDHSNNIHVVCATRGDQPGIYHIRSQDGGSSWELEQRLSLPLDRNEASFSTVQIVADRAGRLHAVWQADQHEGYGQAVYYARSTDDGQSWSVPTQLGHRDPGDFGASFPYLADVAESEVHLIYLDGPHQGRSQRISQDGGETWSEPVMIIAEMEGVNGYVQPVVDTAGQMYLIINMRTRATQTVGIYYARWSGHSWSSVVPVDISSPAASSAHYTAATVRLGNEIHVVYNDIEAGEIWHVRGLLANVEPQPAEALAPARTPMTPTLTVALTNVTPSTPSEPETLMPIPSPAAGFPIGSALMLSVGTALLLVVAVIVWMRVRAR